MASMAAATVAMLRWRRLRIVFSFLSVEPFQDRWPI